MANNRLAVLTMATSSQRSLEHPTIRQAQSFREAHRKQARSFDDGELRLDAMVFSPHPDDETLGCGATMMVKLQRGAAIDVVFMTDGSGSHPGLIAAEDLGRQRQREAMAATASLGLSPDHVTWLAFPDGGLAQHHAQAVARVAELLRQQRPPQIFVPFLQGEHPDHSETQRIVIEALTLAQAPTLLCEYPIWYLNQWPLVRSEKADAPEPSTAGSSLDPGPLAPFNIRMDLTTLADRKHSALAEHKSQMARRNGDPRWHTLGDIAGGDFLENFFDAEIFRCQRLS